MTFDHRAHEGDRHPAGDDRAYGGRGRTMAPEDWNDAYHGHQQPEGFDQADGDWEDGAWEDGDDPGCDDAGAARRRVTRRGFLGAAGVGGAAAAFATAAPAVEARFRRDRDRGRGRGRGRDGDGQGGGDQDAMPTRFGRMFPNLQAFGASSDGMRESLTAMTAAGGILDANDALEEGPVRLLTEPELSANNPNNPNNTAGTTFLGQFLDHDITRDAGSRLGRPTSLRRSTNLNSPRFDLDTVYGGGPVESPELFTTDPIRFRVESGGLFEDLPRDENASAIIADPRNDENMMISGLQVSFLMFHNAVAERVEASGLEGMAAFEETQRLVRWHWQWIIVHEYLPQIVPAAILDDMAVNGPQFFTPAQGQIPVEFQTGAFRFGHSQVRPSYRANLAGDNGEAFFAMVFDPDDFDQPDPASLVGGHRAPRRFIGWQTFFDFGDGEVRPNKKIDTKISTPLFRLPAFTIDAPRGGDLGPATLPTRNLLRHITWEVPSGQAIAAEMGVDQLSAADLAEVDQFGSNLGTSTPLWYYVLREAELVEDGERLGPVGGRIVAELFTTLLGLDPTSFPGAQPDFTPTLPSSAGAGEFRMVDLLTLAGVDPTSRGQ
jgi:hypothetical protein